jgi:uncharacterized protein (DUF934 family)
MPIIDDNGFRAEAEREYLAPEDALASEASELAVFLPNEASAEALKPAFDRIALIAVEFPSFADGRGFSLGRRLRALGYKGVLRAKGPLISDQYAFARGCGFDEVEIDDAMAARQPEAHWLKAARNDQALYKRGRAA